MDTARDTIYLLAFVKEIEEEEFITYEVTLRGKSENEIVISTVSMVLWVTAPLLESLEPYKAITELEPVLECIDLLEEEESEERVLIMQNQIQEENLLVNSPMVKLVVAQQFVVFNQR